MIRHLWLLLIIVLSLFHSRAYAEQDWLYSVRPGDNLWNLCLKYTTKTDCWLKLGDYNNVEYPRQLPPGLIIRFPVSWLKTLPKPVTLAYFSGEVSYQEHPDAEITPAVAEVKLPIGAAVFTGDNSIAGLLFGDGTHMQLEPNSTLVLDALSVPGEGSIVDSRTRLQSGAVKTRVPERQPKSRFRISTPAAIAAVRGTEFRVTSYQDDSGTPIMTGEVFEGRVAVAGQASPDKGSIDTSDKVTELTRGYGIIAQLGKELDNPQPLPQAPKWQDADQSQLPPVTLSWQRANGINTYRLEIAKISNTELGEQANLVTVVSTEMTDYQDTNLTLTEGCFVFALRGQSALGLVGLAAKQKVCIRDQLPAPLLEKPSLNFQPDTKSLRLDWQPVTLAEGYEVEISLDKSFTNTVTTLVSDGPDLTLPISDELNQGFYYRVKAVADERVDSEFSQPRAAKSSREPLLALSIWSVFWVLIVAF